jgi:hypothetical protein
MESEIELYEEIQNFSVLATAPDLLPEFIESKVFTLTIQVNLISLLYNLLIICQSSYIYFLLPFKKVNLDYVKIFIPNQKFI